MRAVALGDEKVQKKIEANFIPLKVRMEPGAKEFPLSWPALLNWRIAYGVMGGKDNQGFTGCSVVSPSLDFEYANTGSALIWEMFTSDAYDAGRFGAMLDRAIARRRTEVSILNDHSLTERQRRRRLVEFRRKTRDAVAAEGRLTLPPRGFSVEHATELFRMAGAIP